MQIPDLCHYQRFDEARLQELLIAKRLYMSNPADINDPWDCRPHFDSGLVRDPGYRVRLAQYFEELQRRFPGGSKTPQQVANDLDDIRNDERAAARMLSILSSVLPEDHRRANGGSTAA